MRKLRVVLLSILSIAGIIAVILWKRLPCRYTIRQHPLRYYLSLPMNWSPQRTWPMLVVVDGVNQGHFLRSFLRFQQARHALPFILISPLVVSNTGHPNPQDYPYGPEVWEYVAQQGAVPFDAAGVLSIVDEVQRTYHGEPQFYLTGWSAGGHLTWYLIFTHPERLAGVVLAGANYAGRGIATISCVSERRHLPIRGLQGARDSRLMALNTQWQQAATLAAAHGYTNLVRSIIPNAAHSPFPKEVFTELIHMRRSKRSS